MTVDKKQLIEALEVVGVLSPKKSKTAPILCNTHFEERTGKLMLTGTDLETSGICTVDIIDFHERPAAFTTNTAALLKVLKTYPAGDIDIVRASDTSVSFISGSCTFKARTVSAENFPAVPMSLWQNSHTHDHKFWQEIITKMLPSISTDQSRVNLNGMFARKTDTGATLVSTDGHRLAILKTLDIGLNVEKDCILHRESLVKAQKIIKRFKSAVRGGICQDNINYKLETKNVVIYMRVIDGTFPNYDQVIPLENDIIITVNALELADVMKRLIALSTEKYIGSRFEYDGKTGLNISDHSDTMKSTFTQSIKVSCDKDSSPLTIGLNAKYILDYLSVVQSDTVTLKLKNETTQAVLVCDDNLEAVIMPMKL